MLLGKSLRLRRLFPQGRALVGMVPTAPDADDAPAAVRVFARGGADAIAVSPGLAERIAEEIGPLALVLRLNLPGPEGQRLMNVRSALEMGADAVLLSADVHDGVDLSMLGKTLEEARRWAMPVIAEMRGEDLLRNVTLAAEYGADVILLHAGESDCAALQRAVRLTGRPILISAPALGMNDHTAHRLISGLHRLLDAGALGVMLPPCSDSVFRMTQSLVQQGSSVEGALALLE